MKALSQQYNYNPSIPLHFDNGDPSISETVKQKYATLFYETSNFQNYSDMVKRSDVITVDYEDLPKTTVEGFPIGSDRNESGKLQFSFIKDMPNTHIINIGTTGSGKTTGFVEPGLRAVSSKKNKPDLFITDPKGELFARNASHLKRNGYRVYLINFKDVQHSDCWNPLVEIYDTYIKQKAIKDKLCQSNVYSDENNNEKIQKEIKQTYANEIADILSETADLVNQLVHTLIPDTLQGKNDPSWFLGAQEILSGIIYAMLEDALDERTGFTRDNMNLMTIQDYFEVIRKEVLNGMSMTPLLKTNKLSHKSNNDTSIKQMRSYFENAPTTTRSYLGCFRNGMQSWFNNKIFTVCNGETVKLDSDAQQPFAIFLTTRDFEKSDFTIAGLFIDWVYRMMLKKADEHHGKLKNEMYFILDEFANIPAIKDFENKIATSRSRNIWFQMFIQSYAQLEMVYGGATAQTILDNCNTHVFMGSQNYDTKARFARECGKQTIPSLDAVLNPQSKRIIEMPLLNIHKLETINEGEMYMKRADLPLTLTKFIRSYQCKEFAEDRLADPKDFGIYSLPFNAEKYRYAFLESDKNLVEFFKDCNDGKYEFDSLPNYLNKLI